jgi:LmbE family N-acetylglucosaminyl deacetylase
MELHSKTAEVFIPDCLSLEDGLKRTTHMAISAHQDDIEIMASAPIIECFQQSDKWFTGVVVSDGRGSPRDDLYKDFSDEDMHQVRIKEQKKAAIVGEYAAQILLDYPSKQVKDGNDRHSIKDIAQIIKACQPGVIYTHNLADKHDTHVATALRVIAAIRSLPKKQRPEKLYGCEVWRNLDWMLDADKVYMNVSDHESLQAALLGVFDSQICGGKRYDLAALGRRRSNATFSESHGVDVTAGLCYAMDLTRLIQDDQCKESVFVARHIHNFVEDVEDRIDRLIK